MAAQPEVDRYLDFHNHQPPIKKRSIIHQIEERIYPMDILLLILEKNKRKTRTQTFAFHQMILPSGGKGHLLFLERTNVS